jgi:hypothetical protein
MIFMESLSKQPLLHLLCRLLAPKKRDPEQDQQILMLLIYRILGKDNILLEDTAFSVILEMGRVLGIQVVPQVGRPTEPTPGSQSVFRV